MERKEDGLIVFQNQEDLEMYISAHFEDKYSKIMEAGFENGRKQAIEAIQQYPDLVGVNQFKLDIKAAIKAKNWYSERDVKTILERLSNNIHAYSKEFPPAYKITWQHIKAWWKNYHINYKEKE